MQAESVYNPFRHERPLADAGSPLKEARLCAGARAYKHALSARND